MIADVFGKAEVAGCVSPRCYVVHGIGGLRL